MQGARESRGEGEREAQLDELREALGRTPPQIPCKYLYDDRGSALFEQITQQPEYYPTRTERGLLRAEAGAILSAAGRVEEVIELGSGAASKIIPLLHRILGQGRVPRYLAVDISARALARTRQILSAEPGVEPLLLRADFAGELALPPRPASGSRMAVLLGGTLGNDEDREAVALFANLRRQLEPGDSVLVGANLLADPAVIEAAYNDAAGVTAAFNKNVLNVVNRLAGSRFDPEDFSHRAIWNGIDRRVEMWLMAHRAVQVDLGDLGGTLRLARGEGLRTEISRRFTRTQLEALLLRGGFLPVGWFGSDDGRFGLALGRAATVH